ARAPATHASELLDNTNQPTSNPDQMGQIIHDFYSRLFDKGQTNEDAQTSLLQHWTVRLD
ncbi:hypothetical protein GGI05_005106, partial [Coemansia sp. RSA 2603]